VKKYLKEVSTSRGSLGAESTEAPYVLRLFVAEDVALAALYEYTKKRRAGRIPAVFRLHNLEGFLAKV
jgi:hypothetical protein